MTLDPIRLILTGLLGAGLALFFYWVFRTHPPWVWPWGATAFALVIVALIVWAIVDYQRRRQGG